MPRAQGLQQSEIRVLGFRVTLDMDTYKFGAKAMGCIGFG